MCSITGILDFENSSNIDNDILVKMGISLNHRGPDQSGIYQNDVCGFYHNRLAIIDPENGLQPMTATYNGYEYTIIYNGELYNTNELRNELKNLGMHFKTLCDTEVVLNAYIAYGEKCSDKFNGIFAFAVFDSCKNQVYFSRDRFGVKPFFYTQVASTFLFASEIKALLKHPKVKAQLDSNGLWELLFLTPMKLNKSGILKNIYELPAANHAIYDKNGFRSSKYWSLQAYDISENEKQIIEKTEYLLVDSIERQLVSDVPLSTLLSGGLDSSVISSVAARKYKSQGQQLSTYSFEHEGNKEHFNTTLFQPQSDDDYAVYIADWLGTDHTILTATAQNAAALLPAAVYYRDFPGMADIDSSLLYYCSKIKEKHKVAISGECSDEVFGGYPWFYRPEMLEKNFFPWIHDPFKRIDLFEPDIVKPKQGFEYVSQAYTDSIMECPLSESDSSVMRKSRIASWLSINYFMSSLLERKDRMSMACGLEIRVPFADHRLVEYVYNIPWEIKYKNSVEKALLRHAMKDYLPDMILNRKKSPYPKTHNPQYENIVVQILSEKMKNSSSILRKLLKKDAIETVMSSENATWFGQLMSRPQLIAWLIQLDYWFETYNVEIV